jgi:two-component system, OmpR family, phosphate regulon response regulator PhoB
MELPMHTPNSTTTLLVSALDPGLVSAVVRIRPDLRLIAIDPDLRAAEEADGRLLCFVEWLAADTSGLEIVRRLRESRQTRQAHITMVLDSGDSEERRRALKAGADDYMVGPLDAKSLIDRIAAYESTAPAPPPQGLRLRNGDLTVDLAAHQARWRGEPVSLRPNELRLLTHFMQHRDQVFSRTALIDQLGKQNGAIDDRTVDVWVGRLRRALIAAGAPDPLRTVRSLGYVMDSVES